MDAVARRKLVGVEFQGHKDVLTVRQYNSKEMIKLFGVPLLADLMNRKFGTNLALPSNLLADHALNVGETWRRLPSAFVTGDGIAFRAPGVILGVSNEIVFAPSGEQPVIFPLTPILRNQPHLGKLSDVALVTRNVTSRDVLVKGDQTLFDYALAELKRLQLPLESMDIEALTRAVNDIVTSVREFRFATSTFGQRTVAVRNYPAISGADHEVDKETGVPQGEGVQETSDTRKNWRTGGDHAGLLVRGIWNNRRGIIANSMASHKFGAMAEVPEGGATKIEALISALAPQQAAAKTVVELAISADELRGLLGRFSQDLVTLGSTEKDELLEAGRKLEAIFSGANLRG